MGSTWIMSLMISFIFIFTAFLILAMNFTKVYKMKNEVTTILEKYEGVTRSSKGEKSNGWGSISLVKNYLSASGYSATGNCPVDTESDPKGERLGLWYGATDLVANNGVLKKVSDSNEKFYFCVRANNIDNSKMTYFDIRLFLKFNLPVIGNITAFRINGSTIDIKNAYCNGFESGYSTGKCIATKVTT